METLRSNTPENKQENLTPGAFDMSDIPSFEEHMAHLSTQSNLVNSQDIKTVYHDGNSTEDIQIRHGFLTHIDVQPGESRKEVEQKLNSLAADGKRAFAIFNNERIENWNQNDNEVAKEKIKEKTFEKIDWPAEKLREPNSPYSGFAVEQNELGDFIAKDCEGITPDYDNEWEQYKDEAIPSVLYRGERIYLSNIDQAGKKSLTTRGNERHGNGDGARLSLARDLNFAKIYAVGLDGRPDYYDHVLSKTEIPIGVTFRIKNTGNVINAVSDNDPLVAPGDEMDGLCREFVVENGGEITPNQYDVVGFYIMDDYINPHQRSDRRQPLEYFPVPNPDDLPAVIDRVKARTDELDQRRNQ